MHLNFTTKESQSRKKKKKKQTTLLELVLLMSTARLEPSLKSMEVLLSVLDFNPNHIMQVKLNNSCS